MPKVSIIVIIYKVSEYLTECLESIVSQTYENIEIICVVGKGDEKCEQISRKFADEDKRIKLIIDLPKGTAHARNIGLDNAEGDYIAFVDGDDKIEPDMIQTMVDNVLSCNADVSIVGKYYYYKNVTEHGNVGEKEIYTLDKAYETILYNDKFFLHLWDKLYKKELFEGLKFEAGQQVEDRQMAVKILSNAEKIVYDPAPKYYFRISSDSGSRVQNNLKLSLEADIKICDYMSEKYPAAEYPHIANAIKYFLMVENISVLQNSFLYGTYSKQHDKPYTDYIKAHRAEVQKLEKTGRNLKIKMLLASYFPAGLKYMTKILRNSHLKSHIEFSTGADWESVYKKMKLN